MQITEQKLKKLGFKKASEDLKQKKELQRKLSIAYEHFRYVRKEKIEAFNRKLERERTDGFFFKRLIFTSLGNYATIPPQNVLVELEKAQKIGCFDDFEIAQIERVKEDPILFGRVKGCSDRFFISQWDDDVKIEDILGADEG